MAELEILNVDTLMDMAQERDVEGRSNLNKAGLVAALENHGAGLGDLTVDQLTDLARAHEIEGRSTMDKDDLVAALRNVA